MTYHVENQRPYIPNKKNTKVMFDAKLGIEVYNCKIKYYPDGKRNITFASHAIFHPGVDNGKEQNISDGYPDTNGVECFDGGNTVDESNSTVGVNTIDEDGKVTTNHGCYRDDVLKRNRERVFDIVYCNDWYYFLTITFDPKLVDSTNVTLIMRKLGKWLNNQVSREGLRYILIPEKFKHSDGIHCHALINDVLPVVDSGRVRIGKQSLTRDYADKLGLPYSDYDTIYNVPSWKYGYSTAIRVNDNSGKLSVYLTKYITKGNDRIFGKYYWSSKNIDREPYTEYYNVPFDEVELEEYQVPGTVYRVKYLQEMEYTVE